MITSPSVFTLLQRGLQLLTRAAHLSYVATGTAKLDTVSQMEVVQEGATWLEFCAELYPACFVAYALLVFTSTAIGGVQVIQRVIKEKVNK